MPWKDGLYLARGEGYRLDIRVDRGGAGGRLPPAISCDLIQEAASPPHLLATFRTEDPSSISGAGGDDQLGADLVRVGGQDKARLDLSVTPDDSGGAKSAGFQWFSTAFPPGQNILLAIQKFAEGVMRVVTFEIDRDQDVPEPVTAQTLPTGRSVDWVKCLAEAGIGVYRPGAGDSLFLPRDSWNRAEIHAAIYGTDDGGQPWNSLLVDYADWRVYVLLVKALSNEPKTTGIMLDPERRGAAVFLGTLERAISTDAAAQLAYVYTVVHEIGHTFNLPHAFEPAGIAEGVGSSALTYMNYPHMYQPTDTQPPLDSSQSFPDKWQKFFSEFDFEFAANELRQLRHGDTSSVVMGGAPYVGQMQAELPQQPKQYGASASASAPLCLLLRLRPKRPGDMFEFGEPVHVELELASGGGPVEVNAHLDPTSHGVHFLIRRPAGDLVVFEPRLVRCMLPARHQVSAAAPVHADANLSYDRKGFTFLHPGRYQLQAILRLADRVLTSNTLPIYVRYPTPDVEKAVVPALTDEVATYLSLGGAHHLRRARESLAELAAQKPDHPLARYYHLFEATTLAQGFSIPGRGGRPPVEKVKKTPDYEEFLKALGLPRGRTRAAPAGAALTPFSNVFFDQAASLFYHRLTEDGHGRARQFLAKAKRFLTEHRRVPPAPLRGAAGLRRCVTSRSRHRLPRHAAADDHMARLLPGRGHRHPAFAGR